MSATRIATVVARPRWAALLAGTIALAFVLFLPAGEDAAAHLYQTQVWREQGWQFWDNFWYAGRYSQINYSLIYYPLAAVFSTATVVTGSVAGAAAAFSKLVHTRWPDVATWPAVAFALLAPLPVLSGTYPFLLGFCLGLATLVALQAGRRGLTVAMAAVVAVAHLLALLLMVVAMLGIAAATPGWWRRPGIRTLGLGLATVVAGAALLWRAFSTPGSEYPFEPIDLAVVVAFCVAGALLARGHRDQRVMVGIFGVYAVLAAVTFVVSSPVGSNIGRLLVFMGAPLLLVPLAARGFRPRGLAIVLLGGALLWQTYPAAAGLRTASTTRSSNAEFWYPVEAFLAANGDLNHRVEIVATDQHWEAFYLARRGVLLTRGWYRQDDFPANEDLYDELTPTTYRTWLRRLGVKYVFLPDEKLDYSAEAEAELLRTQNVLPQVARVGDWTVYELPAATPIATPEGLISVEAIDAKEVTFRVTRPGTYRIRLRYTPYWRVTAGEACVLPREPWATELNVGTAGLVTLAFDIRLGKVVDTVLGQDPTCDDPTLDPDAVVEIVPADRADAVRQRRDEELRR